ncbi:MAG: hypothetical protein M3P23_05565, partial [Actinomycetota bacterium]|nr:hypothetical protein [Actinomycetota bacterium]
MFSVLVAGSTAARSTWKPARRCRRDATADAEADRTSPATRPAAPAPVARRVTPDMFASTTGLDP